MARYLGPTCKLARREGTDLFLKSGVKSLDSKCKLEVPPGGIKGERRARAVRLRHPAAREAEAAPHVRRARASVPRLLLQGGRPSRRNRRDAAAAARIAPRQRRVPHGLRGHAQRGSPAGEPRAILVNGERVNMPSYQCKAGDVIALREKAQKQRVLRRRCRLRAQVGFPGWVEVDEKKFSGVLSRCPTAATSCRTSTKAWSSSCIRSNRQSIGQATIGTG